MRIMNPNGSIGKFFRSHFIKKPAVTNDFNVSLVGKNIKVKPGAMDEFKSIYHDLNAGDIFTVTKDNRGITSDGSGIRMLSFVDSFGNIEHGNANIFYLVSIIRNLK
jgi:hypothetical protein